MGVERAFRISGRPGCVAQAARRVLVERGPGEVVGLRFDELLVAQHIRRLSGHVRPVGHEDEGSQARARGTQLLHQRHEREVEEKHRVLGVVQDPRDLVREKPRVDGVHHRAAAGDGVVELEVAVGIPGERGDAILQHAPGNGRQLGCFEEARLPFDIENRGEQRWQR